MPWDKAIAENLKNLIDEGNIREFYTKFESIRKDHLKDPKTINDYLRGKDDEERGLLWWAARKGGNAKLIEYLIKVGGIVNQPDKLGETPLWRAVESGDTNNVKVLLKNKAEAHIRNEDETLLHVAARTGDDEMIELLLAAGAISDVETKHKYSKATPLHIAAEYNIEAIHAIVNYGGRGINLNVQDNDGDTPLHYAARSKTGYNSKYLLMLGASRTIPNNDNKTAAQVAGEYNERKKDWEAIMGFKLTDQSPEAAEAYYYKVLGEHHHE